MNKVTFTTNRPYRIMENLIHQPMLDIFWHSPQGPLFVNIRNYIGDPVNNSIQFSVKAYIKAMLHHYNLKS